MPRRNDIHRILLLGSGPIRIGQAAEFDFSGSQACRALREDGFEVILVNSNPATIQNDPEMADVVYIEPLLPEVVKKIIEIERPDALLAGMGGQTALNIATELANEGVLEKFNVELIGSDLNAIEKAEDRALFKEICESIDLPVPKAIACNSIEEVIQASEELNTWPLLIRPAFTLGGLGGGTVNNIGELVEVSSLGLRNSRINQVLIEESILGWQEHEYEVIRDSKDNCIIVCTMENLDPMGVHTGESIVVAPVQSLSDKDHQFLRDCALKLIRELNICGGCNVQFAVNQQNGDIRVIEVNPRVSRSSALASKATGYPIARMAAKIAIGYSLDELPNPITGHGTTAAFEPTLDYCVVKIPRWPFDKFRTANRTLGTSMKSTGEVMAIGRNFQEAFLKAWGSLETGNPHPRPLTRADESEGDDMNLRAKEKLSEEVLTNWLEVATDRRISALLEAFRRGWSVEKIHKHTQITKWFLYRIEKIIEIENEITQSGDSPDELKEKDLRKWKGFGFSDAYISDALSNFPSNGWKNLAESQNEIAVMKQRHKLGIHPKYRMVDSCAAEFAATTPYYYSTYEDGQINDKYGIDTYELKPDSPKRQVVIGSGPIRIGQGIEFDYGCVHAVKSIREHGDEAIIINNNPETVSTDFDTSNRLYFEPLSIEFVIEILLRERAYGILLQFGGQTAINLALPLQKRMEILEKAGLNLRLLGTSIDAIDEASDRERFEDFSRKNGLKMPTGLTGKTSKEVRSAVNKIGFPVLIRPSYVLGGRGMEVLTNDKQLDAYLSEAYITPEKPILIDQYLSHATELDVDAVSDGKEVLVGAVMEHLEEAGIHSGDSTCFIPTQNIPKEILKKVDEQTKIIGIGLNIVGCFNIQFAIQDNELYVLEVNPRSSRTVPFVAKATGIPLAKISAKTTLGVDISNQFIPEATKGHVCVKAPVFPFIKLVGLDPAPGPEMKSTGEVMGSDTTAEMAYLKARLATEIPVATSGGVYLTVRDEDKQALLPIARNLENMGFELYATPGTSDLLRKNSINVNTAFRIHEKGHPDALDLMHQGKIKFIINVPTISGGAVRDGNIMRRLAVEMNIPFVTTISGGKMEVSAMKEAKKGSLKPIKLQVNYTTINNKIKQKIGFESSKDVGQT